MISLKGAIAGAQTRCAAVVLALSFSCESVISQVPVLPHFPDAAIAAEFNARRAKAIENCGGRFIGRTPTREEWETLISEHESFRRSLRDPRDMRKPEAKADPRRANLCGANLMNFQAVGADLAGANLSGSSMSRANFTRANLWGADLSYVTAIGTDFSGAAINTGSLVGAWIQGAKLDHSILAYVNMTRAYLLDTSLEGANIAASNVTDLVFEPVVRTIPDYPSWVSIKGIERLRFNEVAHALLILRDSFRKAGLFSHERDVTFAIEHTKRLRSGAFERIAKYLLFELTVNWGRTPSKALVILVSLIVVFTVPYVVALRREGRDGIWRKWDESALRRDLGEQTLGPLRLGWANAIAVGLYFSVLSAFHVGWREFNIGTWITRLQAREYALVATGWVRSVSGIQSLLSVYLFAIWVLTLFGRPFE